MSKLCEMEKMVYVAIEDAIAVGKRTDHQGVKIATSHEQLSRLNFG